MLESTGNWNKQKMLAKAKVYQVLIAIDKFISVTPNIKVHMPENIYAMVCESKIIHGFEVWGLKESWEEVDEVHSIFCKKLIGIPNCAANGFYEMELGRETRRGKCIGQTLSTGIGSWF
jgi:hypothetical protein